MQPKSVTRTHNGYHLGDNLVHLNFLRKVAQSNPNRKFVHAVQWQYIPELRDLIRDVPNLGLTDINYLTPADSINAWRGANGFWYLHDDRNDFVKFHTKSWFPHLAARMNVENPVTKREDMLFDYPAIQQSLNGEFPIPFDVLVINSAPGSGQFGSFNAWEIGNLTGLLADKGHRVIATAPLPERIGNVKCTRDAELSVTQIGWLSLHCHTILMVSTGPSWPTFNVWNQDSVKLRIILLDSERVHLSPNTHHCSNIERAAQILTDAKLL